MIKGAKLAITNNAPSITTTEGFVQLDETPSGIEEKAYFDNPDHEMMRLRNHSFAQDTEERKKFADRAFFITKIWVGFLMLLTIDQALLRNAGVGLTEIEFNIVFTTTTGSVLVYWYLVGKYLFNSQGK